LADYTEIKFLDFKTFLLSFSDDLNLFIILEGIDFEKEIKIGFSLS
jgi:hypothetical protein